MGSNNRQEIAILGCKIETGCDEAILGSGMLENVLFD